MNKTTRPFVNTLQSLLQNRLPADEYQQIMEESLWEYQKLLDTPNESRSLRSEDYARFCSICVSFYRAMVTVGMQRHLAAGAIADASRNLDWSPAPPPASEVCSLARFFHGKDALGLCEVTFCVKCPLQAGCPSLSKFKSLKGGSPRAPGGPSGFPPE